MDVMALNSQTSFLHSFIGHLWFQIHFLPIRWCYTKWLTRYRKMLPRFQSQVSFDVCVIIDQIQKFILFLLTAFVTVCIFRKTCEHPAENGTKATNLMMQARPLVCALSDPSAHMDDRQRYVELVFSNWRIIQTWLETMYSIKCGVMKKGILDSIIERGQLMHHVNLGRVTCTISVLVKDWFDIHILHISSE